MTNCLRKVQDTGEAELERLLHLYQNIVTLVRQRVVEVADPYKPTPYRLHKINTAIGSPAGELDWRSRD